MRSRLAAVGLAVVTAGSSMLAPLAARASDEPTASVEYDPPHVSVAATEVGLGDLLRLIGAKVGFSVAEGRAALRRVTVSIASASVDDVLRQLLRAENHTILYRQGADAIVMVDRIVLLGAPAEGVPDTGPRPSQDAQVVRRSSGVFRRGRKCDDRRAAPRGRHAPVACGRRGSPPTRGRRGPGRALGAAEPRGTPCDHNAAGSAGFDVAGRGPGTRTGSAPAAGAGLRDRKMTRPREGARRCRRFCIPCACVVPFDDISGKRLICSNEPVPDGVVCETLGAWRLGGDPPGG